MLLVLQIIACARQNSFEAGSFAAWRETRYAAAIMSDRVGGRGGWGWEPPGEIFNKVGNVAQELHKVT